MKAPIGTLQYAPLRPPSWRRRAARRLLLLATLAALVAITKPAYDFVQRRFDLWSLRRATDACLSYSFPPGVIAYCEGDAAIATLRNAGIDSRYRLEHYNEAPSAEWCDSPLREFDKYYGRITGRSLPDSVVFVGGMTNALGARRLVVLSAASGAWKHLQLTAAVLDPAVPGGIPLLRPLQNWNLSGGNHRLISFMPGRVVPANSNRIVIDMGFAGAHRDVTFTLDGADRFQAEGGFGWCDNQPGDWWLDAADQNLVTLDAAPTQIRLFDGIAGYDAPVAAARNETDVVGAYSRGLRAAHASSQQSWTVRSILDFPQAVQRQTDWRLRAASDGSAIFAGANLEGFPALYRIADMHSTPIEIPSGVRYDAVFAPDGQRLYTSDLRGPTIATIAWSLDGRQLWRAAIESEHISAAAGVVALVVFKHDNDPRVPTEIALLSAKDGSVLRRFPSPTDEDYVAVSPDGKSIVVAAENEMLIRDANTGQTHDHFVWPGFGFHWAQPCWLPDGQRIAIAGIDHVYVWDLRPPQAVYRLPIPAKDPRSHAITISSDGRWLVVAGAADPIVGIWDLHRVLPEHTPQTTQEKLPPH